MCFGFALPAMSTSLKWSSSVTFSDQNLLYIYHFSDAFHLFRLTSVVLLFHANRKSWNSSLHGFSSASCTLKALKMKMWRVFYAGRILRARKLKCTSRILFIVSSVVQQVHSLFHSQLSTECDLMLPVSIFSILSLPWGHPVAAYVLFPFYPPHLSFVLSFLP
jgi:hypothetical protein